MSWKVILYNLVYFFAVVDNNNGCWWLTVVVDGSVVADRLEHLFIDTLMFINRILICTVM